MLNQYFVNEIKNGIIEYLTGPNFTANDIADILTIDGITYYKEITLFDEVSRQDYLNVDGYMALEK